MTAEMLPPALDTDRHAEDKLAASDKAGASASPPRQASSGKDAIVPVAVVERQAIERAIDACGGNMTEAAARLGVNVSTIYRRRQSWSKPDEAAE